MEGIEQINAVLDELELAYTHDVMVEGIERYEITIDEAEGLAITGLLYETEDGAYFRLLGYVDEVNAEELLEQYQVLLVLNGDLPTGSYCVDPEGQAIYITVNLPLLELSSELLGWMIEYVFVAQEVYFQEFYGPEEGEVEEEIAQG